MGMIGGGEGAFIGPVHRMAAELDGEIELVCGAFSSDPERSVRSGRELYRLPEARCYPDYRTLLERERALGEDERMDFVAIATPNHVHFGAAMAALDAGFHVVCDKPLTHRLSDAVELATKVRETGLIFCLTHNYTGYPMVREARALISAGKLGSLRRVNCEYLQGWLSGPEERGGNKQAQWRTDPERSGAAGCFGDIGSHGQNLIEFVTGDRIASVSADLTTWVRDRLLDDDGNVLLRLEGGSRGVLSASQIAVGEENNLVLRVYGERGSIEWSQQDPNTLIVRWPDRAVEVRRTGGAGLSAAAYGVTRLPSGHPEGYLEAFAVLYRDFANAVRAHRSGQTANVAFPTVEDGVRGMRFIEAVIASSANSGAWQEV
jgi:predicted dehydrogenase